MGKKLHGPGRAEQNSLGLARSGSRFSVAEAPAADPRKIQSSPLVANFETHQRNYSDHSPSQILRYVGDEQKQRSALQVAKESKSFDRESANDTVLPLPDELKNPSGPATEGHSLRSWLLKANMIANL